MTNIENRFHHQKEHLRKSPFIEKKTFFEKFVTYVFLPKNASIDAVGSPINFQNYHFQGSEAVCDAA